MRSKTTLLLTGLTCALLAACQSTDKTSLARSNSGETYAAPAGTTPPSSTASATSSTATDTGNAMSSDMRNDANQSTLNISSATVQSIETVPRSMDQGSADMQAGTSGTAGSTSGAAGNMLYRVTLRLDDGTTRTFVQNTQPAFQIGERVSVQKGVMQRY
ncbi:MULTISPECIES: hypothetical protein [Janthinobacterium]|uniref:hypothetical protein n=1 Tax=Janthinobacterium TaxID=29580 RepID=UPI0005369475|nr:MULTISPECIES: hypothetical protein [Janthinobacterium]KHA77472.1 hypothetical protein NC77_17640 [Janthinobacterium lividum]MCC7698604.1 hypothetical protein [Janthinobacterium sp. EB271-G4-7A]